jgi:hypothetical protein
VALLETIRIDRVVERFRLDDALSRLAVLRGIGWNEKENAGSPSCWLRVGVMHNQAGERADSRGTEIH